MLKDTDYLFASSIIGASQGSGTPGERLEAMLDAADTDALRRAFADAFGCGGESLDEMTDRAMTECAKLVLSSVPEPEVFYPLLYQYDCCNIKTAIKASITQTDDSSMYFDCATVPASAAREARCSHDFSAFPENMAKGADEALETFAKTGDGRVIDLILDRAFFADMTQKAKEYGVPLIIDYCSARADIVNIMCALRVSRMDIPKASGLSLFERAFVSGGELSMKYFISESDAVADIPSLAAAIPYNRLTAALGEIASKGAIEPSAAEYILDEALLSMLSPYRLKTFGAEIPAMFIIVREAEIKNCRRIAAALAAGASPEQLRKGVRRKYA